MTEARRLFALDQNFPEPIISALGMAITEADLVPLRAIDPRLTTLEDWEVMLALHRHRKSWDGFITADSSMLKQARELAVLEQTKLSLVIASASGHDPLKATGLVLTHLPDICRKTDPTRGQVWVLNPGARSPRKPWEFLSAIAARQGLDAGALYHSEKLTDDELDADPLA